MFKAKDIIYEDNHLLAVNKCCGDLVQPDPSGESALEDQVKAFIKVRDNKPGEVFLGVVHRIDRPVSGLVLFAKSSKALVRLNELIRDRKIEKRYWAVVEGTPSVDAVELKHHIVKDAKAHRARAYDSPKADSKEARLRYKAIGATKSYSLVEVELLTGRYHQIRAQLSKIGCTIKGDLKYGSKRSNPNGGIMLHSRSMTFLHPVKKEMITITAPTPSPDSLWDLFDPKKR